MREPLVKKLLRPLLLLTLVLLAPIVPFLLWGGALESLAGRWMEIRTGPFTTASVVVALLASDIVLPIPSSLISTVAGARLGWFGGTAASWFGMSLGAAIGFGIARRFGRPIVLWFTREAELDRMQTAVDRWGVFVLILTRGVPIVAEASVLLFGLHRLAWRRFLPAVLLSNLGIALAYSAFGDWAQQHAWLPIALGISVALPVFITALVRAGFTRLTAPRREARPQ
jgi:uncharacterized membrane protein YdjX (TVP38/TMEM64 family)